MTSATAVLVIVGPRWLDILRQRQGEATDHVRTEVRLALEAGTNVIPVLVGTAEMPAAAGHGRLPGVNLPDRKPLRQPRAAAPGPMPVAN